MLLIPVFTTWLYPLAGKLGFRASTLRRMSVGMVVAASPSLRAVDSNRLDAGEKTQHCLADGSLPLDYIGGDPRVSHRSGVRLCASPALDEEHHYELLVCNDGRRNLLVVVVTDVNEKGRPRQGGLRVLLSTLR